MRLNNLNSEYNRQYRSTLIDVGKMFEELYEALNEKDDRIEELEKELDEANADYNSTVEFYESEMAKLRNMLYDVGVKV